MSWQEVIQKHLGNKCEGCGSEENIIIHHKIPLSKWGANELSNLTLLCKKCHGRAHRLLNLSFPNLPPDTREKLNQVTKIMGTKNEIETIKELDTFIDKFKIWFEKYYWNLPIMDLPTYMREDRGYWNLPFGHYPNQYLPGISIIYGPDKNVKENIKHKLTCFLKMEEYYPNRFAELCGAQDYRPREKNPRA